MSCTGQTNFISDAQRAEQRTIAGFLRENPGAPLTATIPDLSVGDRVRVPRLGGGFDEGPVVRIISGFGIPSVDVDLGGDEPRGILADMVEVVA